MENLDLHYPQNKDRQMARFFIPDLGEGFGSLQLNFILSKIVASNVGEFYGLFAASGSLLASYTIRV